MKLQVPHVHHNPHPTSPGGCAAESRAAGWTLQAEMQSQIGFIRRAEKATRVGSEKRADVCRWWNERRWMGRPGMSPGTSRK